MLATNLTLRTIGEAWQSNNFAPVPDDELCYTDTSVRRIAFESYAAAVDWTDRGHVTRALRVFEDVIRTGQQEAWSGPWQDELAEALQRDGLRVDEHGRLTEMPGAWQPAARTQNSSRTDNSRASLTEVSRRRIVELLSTTDWTGGLGDLSFLERLYDLDALPSHDSRFATAREDIAKHRYDNDDWDNDWIFSDDRFGLGRGPDETLLRFLRETLHPAVRTDEEEVARLLTALNRVLSADGYQLEPSAVISGYPVYTARRLKGAEQPHQAAGRPADPDPVPGTRHSSARVPEPFSAATKDEARVRRLARGERKDYQCERLPFADGGQADVFRAIHKPTGVKVVLKKLRDRNPPERKRARMRREITLGRWLDGHPHAMPILDADADHCWFVMPYAPFTAEQVRGRLAETSELSELVEALCSVLSAAHPEGWIHRDIKPANVLLYEGRWVLADWGIARRPRGQTTDPQRTRVGVRFGSDGFAAPELSVDAHSATGAADVYSIGQLIGWAVTGNMPAINVPLLPKAGPWRSIVRHATQTDPSRRPRTVQALHQLVLQETQPPAQSALVKASILQRALRAGSDAAARELVALAAGHTDDAALYCDLLVKLPLQSLLPALESNVQHALDIVRAMATLLGTHRSPEWGEVDATIMWLIGIAQRAAAIGALDLLEECCNGAFEWDASWDQWGPQRNIAAWLRTLSGDNASSVASILRQHPNCAGHFSHLINDAHLDHRIRAVLTAPGNADQAQV
ncbi:AbiJ-related protein [Streptomyces parvulus]|uniref:Protein kinase n=1 Tax=Streptomyces parvulus TaxID=146923 RepID=A0ABV5D8T5_9ACTN